MPVRQSVSQTVSQSADQPIPTDSKTTQAPHAPTPICPSLTYTPHPSPHLVPTPPHPPPPSQFHFIRCCFFVCSTTLGSPRDLFYPLLLRCMFSAPYLINHHAVHDLRLQERPGRARAPLHHHVLADACPQFVGGMIHVRAGKEGGRLVGKGGGMVHIRGVVCSVGGGGGDPCRSGEGRWSIGWRGGWDHPCRGGEGGNE